MDTGRNPARGGDANLSSRRRFLRIVAAATAGGLLHAGCNNETAPRRRLHPADQTRSPAPDPPMLRALPPTEEPILRVRIARPRTAESVVVFGAAKTFVGLESGGRHQALRAPLRVSCRGGAWIINDAAGRQPSVPAGTPLWLSALEGSSSPGPIAAALDIDGVTHPGLVALHPARNSGAQDDSDEPDGFDIVNHVLTEAYLPGVLVHELFRHWHPETFAAQAIAARSFATAEHAFFRHRRHFDLTNTQASQMYGGSTSHQIAREAVRRTRGSILLYGDRVVTGYYSSCCGGRAASAVDAIGANPINDIPPLTENTELCGCNSAPRFRWRIERAAADLHARLIAAASMRSAADPITLSSLVGIEVSEVGRSGRPRTYTLLGGRGERTSISAERLRIGANRATEVLGPPSPPLPSGFLVDRARLQRGLFTLEGAGHGHGAGLCQYGAQALAQSGQSHEEILLRYYPGAVPHRAWS